MLKRAHSSFRLTLVTLALLGSMHASAAPRDGVVKTWAILPALYMQNLVLKFSLSSYGKTEQEKINSLKQAEAAILAFSSQMRMIHQVDSMVELETVKRHFFPPFNSLADEIAYRIASEPPAFFTLTTTSPEIEAELEGMFRAQEERIRTFKHLPTAMSDLTGSYNLRRMIFGLLDNQDATRAAAAKVPDRARLEVVEQIHQAFAQGLQQIETTGTAMAGSGALKHNNPGLQRFFSLAIGEYFRHLDQASKLEIISAFLDQPERTSPRERFEIMVMNAGPQFQKLFQVYARQEGFGDEMKDIFKKLESTARPAPWRLVKAMIEREKVPFEWVSIEPKPLGVGTMAQVHRAVIRLKDGRIEQVVVRVMKPGIEGKVRADSDVLKIVAPLVDADPELRARDFAKITPFVQEIIEMVGKELDVAATVRSQQRASAVYNQTVTGETPMELRYRVPKIIDLGPTSKMMIQEFVPGTSFDTFERQSPKLAKAAIEELARIWIEHALVESGFYHSDLHQGNLRVGRADDGSVVVNILDFGMTGQLDKALQARIVALAIVLSSGHADLMSQALWELSLPKKNEISLEALKSAIRAEVARIEKGTAPVREFGEWVAFAANSGVKFPAEFTSLNRGLTLIMQMLENQKSDMSLDGLMQKLIIKNPKYALSILSSLESIGHREWMRILSDKLTAAVPGLIWPGAGEKIPRAPQRSCRAIFSI